MAGVAGMSYQDFSYIEKLQKSMFRQDCRADNSGRREALDGVVLIKGTQS